MEIPIANKRFPVQKCVSGTHALLSHLLEYNQSTGINVYVKMDEM